METGLRLSPPSAAVDWTGVWGWGGDWSHSVGFVATVGVIAGIWPLAGIAVKAVSSSELRSVPAHRQYVHTQSGARQHTRRQRCAQSRTDSKR